MKRKLSIVFAVIGLVMAMSAPQAQAAPGGGAATGFGTISPALTNAGQNTTVTFNGTAVGSAAGNVGTCNIAFTGNGTNETVASGSGGGTLTCGGGISAPANFTVSCQVTYTRDYVLTIVSGNCGAAVGNFTAVCVFGPTSQPPSSYALACGFAIV